MNFEEHLKTYLDKNTINKLIDSLDLERTNSLVLNTNKISKEEFLKEYPLVEKHPFLDNVFYYNKNTYEFGKNYLFDNGAYYIMDAASMLVSEILPINDNDLVLDMCAAPGGKSIYLSLKNKNFNIVSNDISHERCLKMSSNIEKLGLSNVIVTNFDFLKDNSSYFDNKFDKIILDAPCSGSAMFRKNELAKFDWNIKKVEALSETQTNLINKAYNMLKKDGYLVYSTCSFSYEENEKIILDFLKNHSDIETIHIFDNDSFYRSEMLKDAIHLFPCFYKGEGQFICLLHKKEGTSSQFKERKDTIKLKKDIISKYNLDFKYYFNFNNFIYGSNINIDLNKIPLIRYGVNLFEVGKNDLLTPTFNLAHYFDASNSILLDEIEFANYIKGLQINKKMSLTNDFYIVSYKNINLGYIKYVNGNLKNYYPKGLRH